VGINKYRHPTSAWLGLIEICYIVASLLALRTWGDWQPQYPMYCLSSSVSPSIRTWDQFIGETLAGKSSHHKVEWTNRVGSYWIDLFSGRWNSFGHSEEKTKSRNNNGNLAKDVHIQHSGLIHIDWIHRQTTPNWQLRTLNFPKLTKTCGIASSC